MPSTIRRRPWALAPWAVTRHKHRYGLAEMIRREYLGGTIRDPDFPSDDEVLAQVPPAARQAIVAQRAGGAR